MLAAQQAPALNRLLKKFHVPRDENIRLGTTELQRVVGDSKR
ncbi:hypothetical protein FF011L_34120 [Roseimaritima multifibrata]|uniref:Uncharacterized protein n=1 Tax=Roseimaritima multifibrata TaxID=1930274 RepID=A0A517MIB7_9BACT|nr:hypothetical protein FF011L_34120 [Roseimaritima multifibrata]